MAAPVKKPKPKGNIFYEILIVILTVILVLSIWYPKKVWEKLDRNEMLCRDRMHRMYDAEVLYNYKYSTYTDTLDSIVKYIKTDPIFATDTVMAALRDTFFVKIYRDYLRDYADMPTKKAEDSAFNVVTDTTDTAKYKIIYAMLDSITHCPTVMRPYNVTVVDTSAAKGIIIQCPIDSVDVAKKNSDFLFHFLGGATLKNHGKIENGEVSWIELKRK